MVNSAAAGSNRLLKDDAYDSIKRMIIEGSLRPDELLSERKLGKSLGIAKDEGTSRIRAKLLDLWWARLMTG